MLKNILISGAGIAGPTLAFWLARYGMRVTVVERASKIRTEGQTIDVRGAGIEIMRKMGIDKIIRNSTTEEEGIKFVDGDNHIKAAFPVHAVGGPDFVSEIEIVRGELATILYEHTRNNVEYIFGDKITGIVDRDDRVQIKFAKTTDRDFDLVLIADGLGSRTRELVNSSYFSIPYEESDGTWARWYNAPGRRCIALRPDGRGRQTTHNQKAELHKLFGDAGWEAPRVLSAMDRSTDFYLQEVAQLKMNTWSKGRIALLGDAGYCPSPISDMGTTVAIVGAYVLAGEIAHHKDYKDAFASYETILRPFITKAQALLPGAPQIANPQTQ
ncbi:unnamed protein product [Adineta ricciae]|uniref:FAD-binding domain-containing protein n=1 Tax=Adineta ricciae TaxID=249248 RepID=A0A815KUL0_ADIRI|nr:unnamed protein product [Adineta ricciae]